MTFEDGDVSFMEEGQGGLSPVIGPVSEPAQRPPYEEGYWRGTPGLEGCIGVVAVCPVSFAAQRDLGQAA